jgi:PAS domain S-box-containing protein
MPMKRREKIPSSRADLAKAIADAWYRVAMPHSAAAFSKAETRQVVGQLAQRVLVLLSEECGYEQQDVDALASRLLSLRLPPEALGELQHVLMRELLEDASIAQAEAMSIPPSRLIADLATALLRQEKAAILKEHEEIQGACISALRSTERQLHVMDAAVESSITAIALWSLDGEIFYVNPAFRAMWGYDDREALEGTRISDLWMRDSLSEMVGTSLEQAGGWIGKLQGLREDGTRFSVMVAASLVEPDDGTAPFVMGSFVDMTYREQLSAMLWERVDRLKALRQVDRGILGARSPQQIGEAALRRIRFLVPCERASVTLLEPGNDKIKFVAAVPRSAFEAIEIEHDLPTTGFEEVIAALQQDRIELIHGVDSLPLPTSTRERLGWAGPHTHAIVPLHSEERLLGSLNVVLEYGSDLTSQRRSILREVADSLAVAIRHAQLDQSIAEHREQLRALTARLAEVDEKERRRLARDLHDQIGQRLTALGINLNVVKAQLDEERHPQLLPRLEDSLTLLKETTDRVRRVIADLRPPMLDDYGLMATLRWCAEELAARTDIRVRVRGEEPEPRLSSPVEDALVRITQEALTNVAKHAEATGATIGLSKDEDVVRLTIVDNGVGFAPDDLDRRKTPCWGLMMMTERAEAVGARCRIESEPGRGAQVIVEVPQ